MRFFGVILILVGLPLCIVPIIGIPLIIIGLFMIISGVGSSNAQKTARALADQMKSVEQKPAPVIVSNGDADKWAALAKYDDDVRAAVEQLAPLGTKAIDRLRTTYLALNDKSKLPAIVADIQTELGSVRR